MPLRVWVAIFFVFLLGFIGSALGVLASSFVPLGRERFTWYPKTGGAVGWAVSAVVGVVFVNLNLWLVLPATFLTGLVVSYLSTRLPRINQFLEKPKSAAATPPSAEIRANQMCFKRDWNVRPRFETEEEGLFVGRTDFLDRLNSHFISRSGGTILISGVRGVGKTSLVDRALVSSRQKLQNRYWKATWKYFEEARPWHIIDRKAWRVMLGTEGHLSPETADYLTLKKAAERYSKRPVRWWHKFDAVDRRIRRMYEASRWQLLVLKFSASDISGALPNPDQPVVVGKPHIDPEKLLRSIIRMLYVTFDPSRAEDEAKVLQWSLRDKTNRQLFFDTLNAAYKKSISKSYKELFTNTISDLLKQTQSSTLEGKINLEKVGLVLLCVIVGAIFSQYDPGRAWYPLEKLLGLGIPATITGYVLLSWGWKRVREKTSDQSQQSSFSYEYDYSMHQMRQDLESLIRILSPRREEPATTHDPFRCFRRTIVIFDELDKLERADQQLEDVITHFKNFFTLSEAVFVFLTDHEFYEHLTRETVKAQMARHYPPQHTFFNEKIYLRKPEFMRFREAFFRFTDPAWIEQQARALPPDAMLIDDILKRDEKNVAIVQRLELETLTQLFVQRRQYKAAQTEAIEEEFKTRKGLENAFAAAQAWAGEAMRGADGDVDKFKEAFDKAEGWKDAQAISFLYHRRDDLAEADKKKVEDTFDALPTKFVSLYEGVDAAPFTLSDLARALCFQTRNHYFDLYNAVYDYVTAYEDGAPVLAMDQGRYAHDPKLWSRYQQLLEIAFDSARENHPSREYFNALLMESLYRAFDKRGSGETVKIGAILFPPRDEIAAAAKTILEEAPEPEPVAATPGVKTAEEDNFQQLLIRLVKLASDKFAAPPAPAQQNGNKVPVQPYTDRDCEKINQAIIRLLRLALAHDAIRGVTPTFRTRLNSDTKPELLAELEFAWKNDSYANIRSVIREQHEQDLLNFWKTHQVELEAFDRELTALWWPFPFAGESLRLHTAIGELRTKAEVVGIGQGTVSGPDATALKTNVGIAESREAQWPRMIIDRIRAEDDANVIETFDPSQVTDTVILQAMERKPQIEEKIGATVRGIVNPRDTKYAIYLVVAPVSATVDWLALKSVLPEKTSLFWYVTGKKSAVFRTPLPEQTYFYYSPSTPVPDNGAKKLIEAYVGIVSAQRLETIITHLQATQLKDAQLAQRAGAEVLGPIVTGSLVQKILGDSTLARMARLLKEKQELIKQVGVSDWTDVSNWSAAAARKQLAEEIVQNGNLLPENAAIIEQAVADLFNDPNNVTPDAWSKAILSATEGPNAAWLMLVRSQIGLVFEKKLNDAKITDQSLRSAIKTNFMAWLANAIQSGTANLNVDSTNVYMFNEVVVELERQRKVLRTSPLPATPVTTTDGPSIGPNRRSRLRDLVKK